MDVTVLDPGWEVEVICLPQVFCSRSRRTRPRVSQKVLAKVHDSAGVMVEEPPRANDLRVLTRECGNEPRDSLKGSQK